MWETSDGYRALKKANNTRYETSVTKNCQTQGNSIDVLRALYQLN